MKIYLGNLDTRRDWGYAPEYVEAMWLMLQREEPEDLVIGTGESHSVKEFLEEAFSYVGLDWREHVTRAEHLVRPLEVDLLVGDASLARAELGWSPTIRFEELVEMMVDAEVERIEAKR